MKKLHYFRLFAKAAIIPSMFLIAITGSYWVAGIMSVILTGIWLMEKIGIYD